MLSMGENMKLSTKLWPISAYTGKWPDGEWIFVEEFKGTELEVYARAALLQKEDKGSAQYRIWDCR